MMKHHVLKASLVWAGILLSFACYGQDIPFGAMPLNINSSFAGEANGPRVSSNFGIKSPASSYDTWGVLATTSYDQFVHALRSGVGISSAYFTNSGNNYSSAGYSLDMVVAPKFSLKGKYTISPSLAYFYANSNSTTKNWLNTNENQFIKSSSNSVSASILLNTQKWYVGYGINLYYQVQYMYSIPVGPFENTKEFNSTFQAGYTFQRNAESKFAVTPQISVWLGSRMRYFEFDQYLNTVHYNLTFRYGKFIWGINNAGFYIGLQSEQLRVMLTNWVTNGNSNAPYTGNISFRYIFKKTNKQVFNF